MKKGSGYHLDQVLLGIITFIGGVFGLPWMCAATVRTLCHVSSLSVYSRYHAPGEKPKLVKVREQRVTNIAVNLLLGKRVCEYHQIKGNLNFIYEFFFRVQIQSTRVLLSLKLNCFMLCRFISAMGAIAEADSHGRPVWDIFIRGCVGPEQFTALPQNEVVIYSS